jgi:hypothetical protein
MAAKKGKGIKKNKAKKVNKTLKSILASLETMSAKLDKLEEKIDSFGIKSERQGQREQKGGPVSVRSTSAPGAGGGRGQRVATKGATTKKPVAGKPVGTKVIIKKKRKLPGKLLQRRRCPPKRL